MNSFQEPSYGIYHDLWINKSIQDVFQAISESKELIHWWPKECSGNAQLGAIYNLYFSPEYNWFGKVVKFQENKSFHIKMTDSDEDWNPTSFGFDLSNDGGKTKVNFWHTGWPACNDHFKRSSFCWAILLQGLKNYLEKGIIIPFEERE
ncbi:SRPBCC domain-containing protein [Algoriphagus sp.]|uniref:SRPBCC family protein n=1 Tax=Algoriphagus sp. TaxID=1872435 RepID=UPI0025D4C2F9|nr:SRPBCC domain-containing protein [Algoriphagus sp.]